MHLKPGQCIYEFMGVEKDADAATIRKAYLKMAVQLHPDKAPNDPDAKERFQTLQRVYTILSDPEKRKLYDRTGSIEDSEDLTGERFDTLYQFYRSMYAPISKEVIEEFASTYRGTAEERGDLLKFYEQFEGDMKEVFSWVMVSDEEADSHRFADVVEAAIEAKEVQRYKKFTAWAKEVAKRPRPAAKPAAEKKDRKGKGKKNKMEEEGTSAVAAMMAQRKSAFDGMLAMLSEKYGDGSYEEPTDAEFEETRRKMAERVKNKKAKK